MRVFQKARRDAAQVRKIFGIESGSADLERIGHGLEATVFYRPLGDISGLISKQTGQAPQIIVNSAHSVQRQRFTLAHELGHLVERGDSNDEEYSFIEYRQEDNYDLHEFYADEFAGALLMPEEELHSLRDAGYPMAAVAAHFGVSVSAVQKRITRLESQPTIK